jgi:hypothetical protein
MAEKWRIETTEEANIRRRTNAENMANKQSLETPQQHQNRIEKVLEHILKTKKWE